MAKKKIKLPSVDLSNPDSIRNLDQETLIGIISRLYEQNRQLSEILQIMVRENQGPKTERFVNPEQLRIFDSNTDADHPSANEVNDTHQSGNNKAVPPARQKPKKPGHSRNPMPVNLEREPVKGNPSDSSLFCICCNKHRVKINELIRNSRYEYKPASIFIQDFIDMIFECPSCGDKLVIEPDTKETIANGMAGPALQAEITVARYVDHMPLNRQEERFARMGVPIARSTMVGWMKATASTLKPLYDRMHKLLLLSKVIATDDTPVKVLDRTKKKKIKVGRIWIYRGNDEYPFNLFAYTEGRGRAGPMKFLSGFTRYLQGDCFSGNLALCAETGAIFVACLVHARRYFIKALPNNKSACEEILHMFADLFEIERTARDLELSSEETKQMRAQEAKPILDKMKNWLDAQAITVLPRSAFGKGVNYCLNNWTELTNYLLDGDLRAENNLAEHEMKRVACGRKNWYFLGSDEGGRTAQILLSIISTCRRHDVNPSAYLKDVIQTLTDNPDTELDSLLPNNWKPKRDTAEIAGCYTIPKLSCAQ